MRDAQCPDCDAYPGTAHRVSCPTVFRSSADGSLTDENPRSVWMGAHFAPGPSTGQTRVGTANGCGHAHDDANTGPPANRHVFGNPLMESIEAFFAGCVTLAASKNHDYAGDADPLANFRECERVGVPVHSGIMVRMGDKWARLCRLLSGANPQVADESIADTLRDLSNYCAILAYTIERKED